IYWLFQEIPTELEPTEDRGEIVIRMNGPEGATFSYMDRVIDQMVEDFKADYSKEDVSGMVSVTSPGFGSSSTNSGFVRFILADAEDREKTQGQYFNEINQKLKKYTGVKAFASQAQSIGNSRGGLPIQYVLQAPTLDKLKEVIPTFMTEVGKSPIFIFSDINLKFTKPELEI